MSKAAARFRDPISTPLQTSAICGATFTWRLCGGVHALKTDLPVKCGFACINTTIFVLRLSLRVNKSKAWLRRCKTCNRVPVRQWLHVAGDVMLQNYKLVGRLSVGRCVGADMRPAFEDKTHIWTWQSSVIGLFHMTLLK